MASKQPFFLTGTNARILLNNRTVAYATDINYRITVGHTSPRVLGRFEVETHQPVTYDVEGELTVIRYARGLKEFLGIGTPEAASNDGNGIGSYGVDGIDTSSLGLPNSNGQFDGQANDAFNPGKMFQSKMFDIEIRQKVPGAEGGTGTDFAAGAFGGPTLAGLVSGAISGTATGASTGETQVVLLRDCRLTHLDFRLAKRNAAVQRLRFVARYADDDTYIASKSGVGQELS